MRTIASQVLMVRPAGFTFNEETATNNAFQTKTDVVNGAKVLEEFDAFVAQLQTEGIAVMVIDDTNDPVKPDAIFPNNWFCTLPGGKLVIFPMYAPNRRIERRKEIIEIVQQETGVSNIDDETASEQHDQFLEGTGSMVIDHQNATIYACLSPRTNKDLLKGFAEKYQYKLVSFAAFDEHGVAIYHTNVMMHIGDGYAVVCTHAIYNHEEQQRVLQALQETNHTVIPISFEQMNHFAGNMLQLQTKEGEKITVLSRQAYHSLSPLQIEVLMKYTRLVPVDVTHIETTGGGSVRCMMAEIFR